MAPVEKYIRWTCLDNHIIYGKFFTRAISFQPETCENVKAALDASFWVGHREQASDSDSELCAVEEDSKPPEEDFEHFGQDFLKLKFRRDFEAEVWSAFCRWCFEEVTKLNLGQYSEARFGQEFNFRLSWDADVWLKFWSWCLIDIL